MQDFKSLKIIAVSKTFSIDQILPLIKHGHLDYGENKVQEAINKWSDVRLEYPDIKLHLIGKLQSNKTKLAVNENLSVSYGMSTVDFETASLSDEESSGISASYTMGGMTIAGVFNAVDSQNGTSGRDRTRKEISVAFAF